MSDLFDYEDLINCPECKSQEVKEVSSGQVDDDVMGGLSWSTFMCKKCNHVWSEVE